MVPTPKFGTSKEDIARVRKEVDDALLLAEADVRTVKAFREANQSICDHKGRGQMDTCPACGKYFQTYYGGRD